MSNGAESWSRTRGWLEECRNRFGEILDLPVGQPGYREMVRRMKPGARVLDIGAGKDQVLRGHLKDGQAYATLDVDPDGSFDFRSFDEIPATRRFDVAVANQMLEHLPIRGAEEVVAGALKVLEPGGELVVSVPNTSHPVRYWSDPTHVTPWSLGALYCLLRAAGFEVVDIKRLNKYPLTRNPLKRWLIGAVCTTFRVDWCDTLLMIGRKAAG
jgi:SAM-dependent methyltransferase